MKHLIPIMVILLMVSTSFVGVSNQVEVLMVDNEQDELPNQLEFYCYGQSDLGSVKYEYLKEKSLKEPFEGYENVELLVDYKPILSIGGPADTLWPMKCHDLHHTSRSPYSTVNVTDLEKWRYRCGGVDGGIVIDDAGIIYFGDQACKVNALYPNGTLKWRNSTDMWITSTPALAENGTLYVGSWDKKLYAFNSTTGERIWQVKANDGTVVSSPAIGEDGTIYIGTLKDFDKGEIIAVNANGSIKWIYPTGYYITCDPVIGDDGTIFIGSGDTYLYAMNPDGSLKWRFKTGHYIKGPASIADDGTVYVGSYDDYLYALYPNNGTMKWKCKVGHGTETNPSIAEDGTIYVGGSKLYAVNPNGTKKWTFDLGNGRHIHKSCPAISADGTIYVGTNINSVDGGDIIAINPNGTQQWRKKVINAGWIDCSPCIGKDGTVYIGSRPEAGGYIHAFGPVELNNPPETPTITGKTNGETGIQYQCKIRSIDPDNNPIKFYIDWGDGSEGWEREGASGEECYYYHIWSEDGNYTIRCKVKDVMGEESDWAYLEVTMPHSYNNPFWRLNGLLDRFPLLQRLLEVLIR